MANPSEGMHENADQEPTADDILDTMRGRVDTLNALLKGQARINVARLGGSLVQNFGPHEVVQAREILHMSQKS